MKRLHGQAHRAREPGVEAGDEELLVEHGDDHHRQPGDDTHELHVRRPDGRCLAEEEFVDAAFVPGGQALNHRHHADADGEERREHEAERGVLLQARGLLNQMHRARAQQPRERRADEDGHGVFAHVPEKAQRHAGKNGVRKGVAHQCHLAHYEK